MNILELIEKGESQTVEFKKSFDKEAIETIAAFANSDGGYLIVGLKDDGKITGTDFNQETVQKYFNQVKNATEPSLMVDFTKVDVGGKPLLVIRVDEFHVKPVKCKGRFFKRIANSNHQMGLTEISNMHLQSLQLSWDAYPAIDCTIDDLDANKIDTFFERISKSGRFKVAASNIENLKKLNLTVNGKPTNAAKLLFAKDQTVYNIHIGRFKTPSMILDDKMIKKTLFEAAEETMYYILSHIKVAFEFTGEIRRNEIFEYPKEALRELVLNAIVHRDYTSPVDIQIHPVR